MSGAGATTTACGRALDWLVGAQDPTGEVRSWATPLGGEPDWELDSLKFVTALAALALGPVDDPRAVAVVDRAVAFLEREREPHDLWRYWAGAHERAAFTPPDADDTACCSMAVALRGASTAANVAVLRACRDRRGRFYTWLLPRRRPSLWRLLPDERRAATRALRQELWETTEAERDDIDAVVNANVCRYLGPAAPPEAAAWVAEVVRSGREAVADKWHRNRFTAYASVADGVARGVPGWDALAPTVVERIVDHEGGDGVVGPPLDSAMALTALQQLHGPADVRARLAEGLRATQSDDGSWARSVFYLGGPDEVFGWGSEALSTAWAVGALAAEEAGR